MLCRNYWKSRAKLSNVALSQLSSFKVLVIQLLSCFVGRNLTKHLIRSYVAFCLLLDAEALAHVIFGADQ